MSSLFASTMNTRYLPTGDEKYIRSDFPGKLTDGEVAWLRENGVTTVVDLRDETEYRAKPCRLEREEGFEYYHMPVTGGGSVPDSPEDVAERYIAMIDGRMNEIVDTIMNAPGKALYFCYAGKDRTGVVSAVILHRLGIDEDVMIGDYMETKENIMPTLIAFAETRPEVSLQTLIPKEGNIKRVLAALSAEK